jgi:TolB-like protein/Flp pilus assembly protein TadD
MLRLSIFGRFRAADALGNEIPIKSKKSRALLAYLALPPGKERSREEVMALLWSERGDEQARSSLRQALSGLRKELGEFADEGLKVTDEWLALDPDLVAVEPASPGEVLLAGLHINDPAFDEWLRDERLRHENTAAPDPQRPALSLPDKPSIAVLPFTNMSGDPDQEYFSDGITEDIITELTRFRSLFVIARSSSFHYKGQYQKVQDIGSDLGVRYVVEGSVRKLGNRVRITAQLVEAANGNHIWAERWDRELEDIFAVQDDLVRTIVSTVGGRIDVVSKARAARMSDAHLGAYDYYLRAVAAEDGNTKEDYQRARQYLERAIKLDPDLASAHHHLALVNFFEWMTHWASDRDRAFNDAINAAKTAVALDDTDGRVQGQLGMLHLYQREFDEAGQYLAQAIRLNPNDFQIIALHGLYLTAIGDPNHAIERFDQAVRINPMEPSWIKWLRGIACFTAERFEDAINDLRSIKRPINEVRGWLAASYGQLGRIDKARAMLTEFLRVAEKEMAVFPGHELDAWQSYRRSSQRRSGGRDFGNFQWQCRRVVGKDRRVFFAGRGISRCRTGHNFF